MKQDTASMKMRWVWPGRIPSRRVTLIAGFDRVEATLVACKLAAVVSQGGKWPLGEGEAKRGRVVVISPEEGLFDTLWLKMEAAGADLDQIFGLKSNSSGTDLDVLAKTIQRIRKVRMVIFDPATALLDEIRDDDDDLKDLAAFAAEFRLAIVLTAHINSDLTEAEFECLAASQAGLLAVRKPGTDQQLLVSRPSEFSKNVPAITFIVEQKKLPNDIVAPMVRWGEPMDLSFDEAVAPTQLMGAWERSSEFRRVWAHLPKPDRERFFEVMRAYPTS